MNLITKADDERLKMFGEHGIYPITHQRLALAPLRAALEEANLYKERYELEQIRYEGISSANEELRKQLHDVVSELAAIRSKP